jgi:enoyl-CoA hydratase
LIVTLSLIEFDRPADGVATIVLNRPDKLNALSGELISELLDTIDALADDDGVRVVIIRGAGRAFTVGADVGNMSAPVVPLTASEDRMRLMDRSLGQYLRLWDSPKVVITQVHGYCMGMGTVLCNFADIVITAEDATIGWPSLPLGGGVLGPIWAFNVGAHKAKEYSFQVGSSMTGTEAARLGWANTAVPISELDSYVLSLATRIAKKPSALLRLEKEAINQVYERMGFREAIRAAATWEAVAHTDPSVEQTRERIRTSGVRAAIAQYQDESTS